MGRKAITSAKGSVPSQSKVLRIGVIGTGAFAEQCHLPGLQSHPQAKVVAIAGRRPERLQSLAAQFNIPHVYIDYHELCARTDLDAITIVTSTSEHAAQARAGFASGKHVFCEKPLATSVTDAKEMVHTAELSGKVHQVAFTYRYLFGLQELRRRIRRGDIGTPYHLRAQHNSWDGFLLKSSGVLHDVGSHLFDLARFLFGPLQSVIGLYRHLPHVHHNRKDDRAKSSAQVTDDMATAWFTHKCGVQGQWFSSRIAPSYGGKAHIEVIGEEGALRASLSRGSIDTLQIIRRLSTQWEEVPLPAEARNESPSALGIMMQSFVNACLRGKLDPDIDASFHDGLAVQLAMDAVQTASARLPWIPIETTDHHTRRKNSVSFQAEIQAVSRRRP
ncbi:MAG: Gfo/Idh/MocA family oxidoreductase [Nitrospira sp.]